jgi:hypothetical protein
MIKGLKFVLKKKWAIIFFLIKKIKKKWAIFFFLALLICGPRRASHSPNGQASPGSTWQ